MIFDIIKTVLENVWSAFGGRRRVRVMVHRAAFYSGPECFFINVANLSKDREVELTHVWFDCAPKVPVIQPDRMLPQRLKPDESWETWVEVDEIPNGVRETEDIYRLARIRLSTGKVIPTCRMD